MSATKLHRVDHEPARMARRARMRTLRADAIAIATTAGADATIGMAAMVTATTTADGTRTFGGVDACAVSASRTHDACVETCHAEMKEQCTRHD